MIVLRRRLPPHLAERKRAFEALVPTLERAKLGLTQSVPGTRVPGRPLAETLVEFEEGLRRVGAEMDAWRAPELEDAWQRASASLGEALGRAERLRMHGSDPGGFEGLIAVIGDLLAPLDAFAAVAERFRELRRR